MSQSFLAKDGFIDIINNSKYKYFKIRVDKNKIWHIIKNITNPI